MDSAELIWNLKRLIRDAFPAGLAVSQLEPQYSKYFQCAVSPSPSSMHPGSSDWSSVFRKSDKFRKWFRLDEKGMIQVLPEPERDLFAYFRLVCYTQYLMARQGAKIDGCAQLSESDGSDDDDTTFVCDLPSSSGSIGRDPVSEEPEPASNVPAESDSGSQAPPKKPRLGEIVGHKSALQIVPVRFATPKGQFMFDKFPEIVKVVNGQLAEQCPAQPPSESNEGYQNLEEIIGDKLAEWNELKYRYGSNTEWDVKICAKKLADVGPNPELGLHGDWVRLGSLILWTRHLQGLRIQIIHQRRTTSQAETEQQSRRRDRCNDCGGTEKFF